MHAAEAESMRLLRKARGALAESQAFLSAGKRGLSGRECTKFKKLTAGSGYWRTSGVTADCVMGSSVYCGGAKGAGVTEGRKRGSEWTRGGSGGERPVRKRPEEYLDRQVSEG
jgi:hypothetical protein